MKKSRLRHIIREIIKEQVRREIHQTRIDEQQKAHKKLNLLSLDEQRTIEKKEKQKEEKKAKEKADDNKRKKVEDSKLSLFRCIFGERFGFAIFS